MFRSVELPNHIPGRIVLHNMPGRYGQSLTDTFQEIEQSGINRIISLAPLEEIEQNSPDYLRAITAGLLPCPYECLPVPDFGVSQDRERFYVFVREAANRLLAGESILIHCGAGIGRTGMLVCCLLNALDIPIKEALKIAHEAGSGPETAEQEELIKWFESRS